MSFWETMQLMVGAAALFVALLCRDNRSMLWVLAISLDLVVSTAWWRAELPYPDAFTAVCDFSVCIALYLIGRYRWELWLFLIYQFSMLVSIVDFAMSIGRAGLVDHDIYSSVLEACNYGAFLLIGGTAGLAADGRFNLSTRLPWRWLRPSALPLFPQGQRNRP